MVVIRLQRRGTKKVPHHRIVVMERSRPQNGRTLDILGYYNPSCKPVKFALDESRLAFWISSGAQATEVVSSLVKRFKKISIASMKQ